MTPSEEIKDLESKLRENYSEEAKESFKEMTNIRKGKLAPIILE